MGLAAAAALVAVLAHFTAGDPGGVPGVGPFDASLRGDDGPERATSAVRTAPPAPDANCRAGPWMQTGQITATDPQCGLASDGVTDSSAALVACLQLAANCSKTIFFPRDPPTTNTHTHTTPSPLTLLGRCRQPGATGSRAP